MSPCSSGRTGIRIALGSGLSPTQYLHFFRIRAWGALRVLGSTRGSGLNTMTSISEPASIPRIRVRALMIFLIFGFVLSWYPWVLALLRHGTSGPNPLGLLVAALIASAVNGGWRGSRDLLLDIVRVRVPIARWLSAVLIPAGIVAAALAAATALGMKLAILAPQWGDMLDRFVFTFLFVALGEEPAWRGFLLPQLQRRLSPLVSTLIVASVWAIWHLPLWGSEFAWSIVPAFLISLFGGAIILSWLYNSSRNSVLMPMLMHATLNTLSAGYAFHLIGKDDLLAFWWLYASLWLVAGIVAVAVTRGRLGLSRLI